MNLRKMIANVTSRSITQHLVAPTAKEHAFSVSQVRDDTLRFTRPADGGSWNLEIGYALEHSLLEEGEGEQVDYATIEYAKLYRNGWSFNLGARYDFPQYAAFGKDFPHLLDKPFLWAESLIQRQEN